MSVAIKHINIRNLLSFGPDGIGPQGQGLELRPLNILIGANGSGKSNFIEAIGRKYSLGDMWQRGMVGGTRY